MTYLEDWAIKCDKCEESGWVWWYELDEYDGPANEGGVDDTRYTCDKCGGKGYTLERHVIPVNPKYYNV